MELWNHSSYFNVYLYVLYINDYLQKGTSVEGIYYA